MKQHYLTAMVFYQILILSADILLIRMATVLQSLQRKWNTTATTGTFIQCWQRIETTCQLCILAYRKSGYQEFISERPTADPIKAYIKVKTENIGYGELTKTDESSGVKLSGAVYDFILTADVQTEYRP